MRKLLIKLTIKLLNGLRNDRKMYFDLNNNDKNDLIEGIDYLNSLIQKTKKE